MSNLDGSHLLLLAILLPFCQANQNIDLTGPGCDKIGGYTITDENEVVSVESVPNYNAMPTRDHCDVTIRADQGRRIQYLISLIKFNECGIEVLIFDSEVLNTIPKYTIKCGSETEVPIKGMTRYNVLRIRVRQTTPQSRHYEFLMRLKNDLGPTLEYLEDEYGYQGESLQIGVVVGLVIAGIIVIIALVLLAIYLCVRARQANLKENGTSAHGESSIYTSGRVQLDLSVPPKPSSRPVSSHYQKERDMDHLRTYEARRPRRTRPMVPMPTPLTPKDPTRKGLSDRHRSGERVARPASQTKRSTTKMDTEEMITGRRARRREDR